MPNKVVMIGKHGPSLQPPAEFACLAKEIVVEFAETFAAAEKVLLLVGCGGDEIRSTFGKPVNRRVWPRDGIINLRDVAHD